MTKINPDVKYAKIKLDGTISTLRNSSKATVYVEANDELYKLLTEGGEGGLQFSLDVKPLAERKCVECGKTFFPEIKGLSQKYCSNSCKQKVYRRKRKNLTKDD